MKNTAAIGKLAEATWDALCTSSGIPCRAIPVSKKYGEKRPDRLITVGGQDMTVEIKAITENEEWDAHFNGIGGKHGVMGRLTAAGYNGEAKRVCWQLKKSAAQHRMYAEATGDYTHTLTVLVDLRESPESGLAELVSGMLQSSPVGSSWQYKVFVGISSIAVVRSGKATALIHTGYGLGSSSVVPDLSFLTNQEAPTC